MITHNTTPAVERADNVLDVISRDEGRRKDLILSCNVSFVGIKVSDLYFIRNKEDKGRGGVSLESICQSIFCRKYRLSGLQRALEPRGLGRMSLKSGFRIDLSTDLPNVKPIDTVPSSCVSCTATLLYTILCIPCDEARVDEFISTAPRVATCWRSIVTRLRIARSTFPTLTLIVFRDCKSPPTFLARSFAPFKIFRLTD